MNKERERTIKLIEQEFKDVWIIGYACGENEKNDAYNNGLKKAIKILKTEMEK